MYVSLNLVENIWQLRNEVKQGKFLEVCIFMDLSYIGLIEARTPLIWYIFSISKSAS